MNTGNRASSTMNVYKAECAEIMRRFLAKQISRDDCVAALHAGFIGVMPEVTANDVSEVRTIVLFNERVIIDEMERRGQPPAGSLSVVQ